MRLSGVGEYYILSRKDSMKMADNISTVVKQTLITLWLDVYCIYSIYSILFLFIIPADFSGVLAEYEDLLT